LLAKLSGVGIRAHPDCFLGYQGKMQ